METSTNLGGIVQKWIEDWCIKSPDVLNELMSIDPEDLEDSFSKELEFGTGGMRAKMGWGPNRLNIITVQKITQGLANYLTQEFSELTPSNINVVIAYDTRKNSDYFANCIRNVLISNGINVLIFDRPVPTPVLSHAVINNNCQAGIMVTASHNTKEYNGYKIYWRTGAQVVPPHDEKISTEISQITCMDDIKLGGRSNALSRNLGDEAIDLYIKDAIDSVPTSLDIWSSKDIKIVYTPLHGCGIDLMPRILRTAGFTNITLVESQLNLDGEFNTVKSPNPEDDEALSLAIKLAGEINADLVLANDPDADRLGVAIPINPERTGWMTLTGNQIFSLLLDYQLYNTNLSSDDYTCKSIVTSPLIEKISNHYGIDCRECFTGFKNIAKLIEKDPHHFIAGGEESHGYLSGTYVMDKDGISAGLMMVKLAQSLIYSDSSLYNKLVSLAEIYGLFEEDLVTKTYEGVEGREIINNLMANYRGNPPKKLLGSKVIITRDYLKNDLDGEYSDVLEWVAEDCTRVIIRPSGTEPKIKYYLMTWCDSPVGTYDHSKTYSIRKLNKLKQELNL